MDEIEKAHADVFNILLQVLDDGRLTDGQGRTVDFRNTVIIMTSNLGSHVIQEMTNEKESYEEMSEAVLEIAGQHFRPEFINRIDAAVVFEPLKEEQIRKIAEVQIQLLGNRLKEKELSLQLSEKAYQYLAEAGYDPVYGARPLKRAIQVYIENPLAQDILEGKFKPGDTIKIDRDDDHLQFV